MSFFSKRHLARQSLWSLLWVLTYGFGAVKAFVAMNDFSLFCIGEVL